MPGRLQELRLEPERSKISSVISIIIPVYNEEKQLPALLKYLETASSTYIREILVVDGGSTDETSRLAIEHPNVTYYLSEKGRAVQMNYGAKKAKGELLYFLHADSYPPENFDDQKGHILLKNQPIAICDKTAGALADLGRDDIYISESTWHYDGGGCC